ncbi:hypothetical protein [Mycobacterium leprae]|nr:hypothetical protein [Mycobacterium leprae]
MPAAKGLFNRAISASLVLGMVRSEELVDEFAMCFAKVTLVCVHRMPVPC